MSSWRHLELLSRRFIFDDPDDMFVDYISDDYTPTNFDTFPAAIMTVFQVWK